MYTVEGVGCQSSVGHRCTRIGRLWEYVFFKRYKVRISPCFYKLLHRRASTRKPIAYLYNSHVPIIRIADNNNLYQWWNMN